MACHYIYKIVNKTTNQYYIGKRTTSRYSTWNEDPYMGSGVRLKHTIRKHGKENFYKIIICQCETSEEAYQLEALMVTQELVDDPQCYNLRVGGLGGFSKNARVAAKEGRKKLRGRSREFTEEWKENMSKGAKKRKATLTTRANMSESISKLSWWNNGEKNIRRKEHPGEGWNPGRTGGWKWNTR